MNDELLDVLVRQVAASVDTDAEPVDGPEDRTVRTHAWVDLLGTPHRRLGVGLSDASAVVVCGIVAGLSPDAVRSDPSLVQDLANELANIMAGNLWPALEGATGIGLPQSGVPPLAGFHRTHRRYVFAGTAGFEASLDVQVS
jgi:hypothetical protein